MGHGENAGEMIDRKSRFMTNQGQRCRRAAPMIHLPFGGVRDLIRETERQCTQ
jgi:hypothetical protein